MIAKRIPEPLTAMVSINKICEGILKLNPNLFSNGWNKRYVRIRKDTKAEVED